MNKNLWIIANWKSNKTLAEALEWISEVGPKLERKEDLRVVVCPPFEYLEEVHKEIQVGNFPFMVGSQDLSPFPEGAYTGEEAAMMLKQFAALAILGHSERRQNFGESDEMVAKKVEEAISHQMIPLVCVQGAQTPVPKSCKLVAYEPIFAIGTGHPDTPQNANLVAEKLKEKCGEDLEVLYGGSVTSENCKTFVNQEHLNGLLIGKASLDPQEFIRIVDASLGYNI